LKWSTGFDVLVVTQLVFGILDEVPDIVEGWVSVGAVFPEGVLFDGAAFELVKSKIQHHIGI
jgi:hypothetical protein